MLDFTEKQVVTQYATHKYDVVKGTENLIVNAKPGESLVALECLAVPAQSGSGNPSSTNVRTISGTSSFQIKVNGHSYLEDLLLDGGETIYRGYFDFVTATICILWDVVELSSLIWSAIPAAGIYTCSFPQWKQQESSETQINGMAEKYYVTNAQSPSVSDLLMHNGSGIMIGSRAGAPSGKLCYERAEPRIYRLSDVSFDLPLTSEYLQIDSVSGLTVRVKYLEEE